MVWSTLALRVWEGWVPVEGLIILLSSSEQIWLLAEERGQ